MSRGHGPVDRYSGRSTVDSRPGQGGALTGTWRTTATEGGSSPRKHLEKEGTEGNLTEVGGGRHGNGARPATRFNGGGSTHPTRGD
jgi:hypothetical protein